MSITNHWLVQDHILLCVLDKVSTEQEVLLWERDIIAILSQYPTQRIHIIYDARITEKLPKLTVLGNLRINHYMYDNWQIVVGLNPVIKMVANVTGHVLKSRLKIAADMPEALAFLQQRDAALPDLRAAWRIYETSLQDKLS